MLIMPSTKFNFNLNLLIFTLILFVANGCGSFSSSSLVSADGIYGNNKTETQSSSSKYYENYFKEKSLEIENGFIFSDSINLDSDFITSNDINYSSNKAAWGDIPDTIDYIIDYFPYRNRYFGFGYGYGYFGMNPYYGNWYPGYSYYSMRNWYRYGWMYGYYPFYYDFYPYGWWGRTMPFGYRHRYSKYGYVNSPYNNYLNRNVNGNISYNSGKRGSSSGVVVYGNGKTTTSSNSKSGSVSGVTYYNVGRSSTYQDDNISVDNNDIRIRTYKDFVKTNSGVKNNVERNRIYSRPEMGVGNSNSRSSANSSDIDNKRRYYSNPSNLGSGRPASTSQSSWGLSGRNSNSSYSSGVRSYSNPGSSSSSSSSRSYNSSSSTYSRSSGPPTIGSSSRSSSSSSASSSSRGSRQ